MTKKKQVGVRFDSNRTRLKTGETQRPNGTYAYRWSTPDGKRRSIYAPTLEKLREQEEQIIVDKHDGIRSDVKSITVNEMFDLWCQLKRGIKDSTFKNYIYMYDLFVKPSFGKNRLVQVKKSDVRKFYNSLADGKVLKIATIDNVHNVLHQVFQVAVDDGMIRQNPTDNMLKELKLSHGFEREKKEALTVAQQKLFFDYMSAGEFVLKNRFLRSALPARMDYSPDKEHLKHVSDEQIVKTHTKYLTAHGKDYCPFAFCEKAGCNHCSVAVREEANMFAEQIFAERQLKLSTPEEVAAHIIRIPSVLSFRINTENAAMFRKKCSCIAVHLLRKCSVENGISFGEQTVKKLLTDMNNHGKEGNGNE